MSSDRTITRAMNLKKPPESSDNPNGNGRRIRARGTRDNADQPAKRGRGRAAKQPVKRDKKRKCNEDAGVMGPQRKVTRVKLILPPDPDLHPDAYQQDSLKTEKEDILLPCYPEEKFSRRSSPSTSPHGSSFISPRSSTTDDLREIETSLLAKFPNLEKDAIFRQLQDAQNLILDLKQSAKTHITARKRLLKENKDMEARISEMESYMRYAKRPRLTGSLKVSADYVSESESASPDDTFNPFNNTLDQVSESYIKLTGIEGLNYGLDNFVAGLLDKVATVVMEGGEQFEDDAVVHCDSSQVGADDSESMLQLLTTSGLATADRGYLLDALLHNEIASRLFATFFASDISPVSLDNALLDKISSKIRETEPFSVAQRWRALTASAIAAAESWDDSTETDLLHIINQILVDAYQPLSSDVFQHLVANSSYELHELFRDAQSLSLTTKRDILSSRMSVTGPPLSAKSKSKYRKKFDPKRVDSVWPSEMGGKKGDRIIGLYNFGLSKETAEGREVSIMRPIVITEALLDTVKLRTAV